VHYYIIILLDLSVRDEFLYRARIQYFYEHYMGIFESRHLASHEFRGVFSIKPEYLNSV